MSEYQENTVAQAAAEAEAELPDFLALAGQQLARISEGIALAVKDMPDMAQAEAAVREDRFRLAEDYAGLAAIQYGADAGDEDDGLDDYRD